MASAISSACNFLCRRNFSKSGYGDNLILKGGLFIYTLTNFESRATIDVDFLLHGTSNSLDDVKALIVKILATPTGNDYIEMSAKEFEKISPQRKYHGISTQIIGSIKNVRVPFNVDIQKRWKFFLKTIKDNTLEFSVVIEGIQKFLEQIFDAIVNETEWQKQWSAISGWRS